MFFGTGATVSSIQAAGAPGGGLSASPKALVVLVMTKARTPRARGLLEQDQRAANIGLDEGLALVALDMRLVQRRRVQNRVDAGHRATHAGPVDDGPDDVGEVGGDDVEADRSPPVVAQRANQRFAEMAGASGHENCHNRVDPAFEDSSSSRS